MARPLSRSCLSAYPFEARVQPLRACRSAPGRPPGPERAIDPGLASCTHRHRRHPRGGLVSDRPLSPVPLVQLSTRPPPVVDHQSPRTCHLTHRHNLTRPPISRPPPLSCCRSTRSAPPVRYSRDRPSLSSFLDSQGLPAHRGPPPVQTQPRGPASRTSPSDEQAIQAPLLRTLAQEARNPGGPST